ncbi:MAG: class I SAM-dependent methyltransferase [Alphaproteobacteria bacterium]|jgi:SAM-dependent methyltransferase|nr:class I SAM-dependent methyltransferase [Alphaproteobacteria bacterium]
MDDPVRRHPTRAEQLEILATLVADQAATGDRVLDLGCGTGFIAKMILDRRPDLAVTGVDRNATSLADAAENLAGHGAEWIEGDLEAIDGIAIPEGPYRFVVTALTFHDLPDEAKRGVIGFAARHLADGGYFLLYDRLRLTEAALFPLQQSIWDRIERIHGVAMRSAESFSAYAADIAPNNRPASLEDYFDWFAEVGLAASCLHLHGNVALIAGARRES